MRRGLGTMDCSFGGEGVVRGTVPTKESTSLALRGSVRSLNCPDLVPGFSEESGQQRSGCLEPEMIVKLLSRGDITTVPPRTVIQRG